MKSYYAVLIAKSGHLLIGGVKKHVSGRFATSEMAHKWLDQAIETNVKSGREVGQNYVRESRNKPEIPV